MRALRISVAAVFILLLAAPTAQAKQTRNDGERVVVSGPVEIRRDETAGDVVVFHGSAAVAGVVQGNLVVFDGPVLITGTVKGDVVAFRGPVVMRSNGRIEGDLVHSGRLDRSEGTVVQGHTKAASFRSVGNPTPFFGRVAMWFGASFATLILGLLILALGPRPSEALAAAGANRAGAAGWGLAAFFGAPVVMILSFITLIGIPLGIMLLFALMLAYPAGYTATAFVLGRRLLPGPGRRFASFAAGWGILRAVAIVPVLAGLAWFAATVFGLGVVALAIFAARRIPAEPPGAAGVPAVAAA